MEVVLQAEVTVTVEWPDGVPFDEDKCKSIAACGMGQLWHRDVGRPGNAIAMCVSECSTDDVEIIEGPGEVSDE